MPVTLERISLLRNIGQFDSVNAGAQIPLQRLSLIYAENGRGKTTIATILRSLSAGDPGLINERKRLGAQHPPHVVLTVSGASAIFQHGAWSSAWDRIAVFDDAFIAANVCSGIEIETVHRQNLHELILGSQGVTLNATLRTHVDRIEVHNRDLRAKQDAIPAASRGALTVDAFCALAADPDIDVKVHQLAQKIVVIDDPMTSLDEHRSLTTIQEMRQLFDRVSQMIVLSHSKAFLCALKAAMVERDTKVGDLCKELGVTRQTLYRFVGPRGELRPDGAKLLERKRQQTSS